MQDKLFLMTNFLLLLWPGCPRADMARVSSCGESRGCGESTGEDVLSPGSAPYL